LTKTLEELKEIASKHLTSQLEMMKELPTLNVMDSTIFHHWYVTNPTQKKITEISFKLKKLKAEDLPSSAIENV
jgi:hypothetical protein